MAEYQLPIIVTPFVLSLHLYYYHQMLIQDFVNFVLLVRYFFLNTNLSPLYNIPIKSTSAAAIAKMLSGIQFPKNKNELIERVKGNKDKVDNAESIIDTVKELPTKTYRSMTDVEKALAEIR